jgi:hypothetical protein
MNTDRVPWSCPVCSGERVSLSSNGGMYCGDCNRIYPIVNSATSSASTGSPAKEAVRKVA